jgi:hypothetical protein
MTNQAGYRIVELRKGLSGRVLGAEVGNPHS